MVKPMFFYVCQPLPLFDGEQFCKKTVLVDSTLNSCCILLIHSLKQGYFGIVPLDLRRWRHDVSGSASQMEVSPCPVSWRPMCGGIESDWTGMVIFPIFLGVRSTINGNFIGQLVYIYIICMYISPYHHLPWGNLIYGTWLMDIKWYRAL